MAQPYINRLLRSARQLRVPIAALFIITLFITATFLVLYSYVPQGSNQATFAESGYNLTATPTTLYYPWPYSGKVEVEIYGSVPSGSGSINVTVLAANQTIQAYSLVQKHNDYIRSYVFLDKAILSKSPLKLEVKSGNTTVFSFGLKVTRTGIPVLMELFLGITASLYVLTLAAFDFKNRYLIVLIVPFYIAVSALMGQRYDIFFMITSGIRYIQGINPFIASSSFPPSLKWEYPPLYLIYSAFSYIMAMIGGLSPISNNSLNFPGTESGFTYMAWRAFIGPFLVPYFILIKVPMILATLAIYFLLNKKSKIDSSTGTKYWLLNPYVIVVGITWGQLDVLASFFLLFSLIKLKKNETGWASLLCALGTGIKVFPFFLLPGILRESANKLRDLGIFIAGLSPNILVYFLSGSPISSLTELFYSRSVPTFFGKFSTNGVSWQLVTNILGLSSFPSLFLYVFLPFYVVFTVLFLFRKGVRRDYSSYLIIVVVAFFLTYNYVNPQYFIWALPIFLFSEDFRNAGLFSAIPLAYMYLSYQLSYFINPYLSYNYFSSLLGQVELARVSMMAIAIPALIAVANLYFILLIVHYVRSVFPKDQVEHGQNNPA